MTQLRRFTALAIVALLAGCGSAGTVAQSPTAVMSSRPATAAAARSSAPASVAAANAKLIADALASNSASVISALASSVSGAMMGAYIRHEALQAEAYAAEGQPFSAEPVYQIPGGYKICSPSTTCESFTSFRSDASGRITDLYANGGMVSKRLAVGADSTGSGLEISDVSSLTSFSNGVTYVTFRARDISWHPVNTDPPFIPVFVASDGSRFEYDVAQSAMPSSLQPGQSAAVSIGFDTDKIAGQFSLTENGPGNTIVSTTLHGISGGSR
jgi:hypothetical protein